MSRTPTGLVSAVVLTSAFVLAAGGASAEPSIEDMERKIDGLSGDLGVVIEQYNRTRDKLADIKSEAARLGERLRPMERRLEQIYADVGEISEAVYKGGGIGVANAILRSGSPQTLVDQLATLHWLAEQRKEGLRELQLLVSRVDRQKSEIDSLLAEQRRTEHDLAVRKKRIQERIALLQELRRQVYGERAARGGRRASYIPPYIPGERGTVVRYAQAQVGDPYEFGSDGPETFDCSGLSLAAWRTVGKRLPHSASRQYESTERIEREDLTPGDLVFYYNDIHHVGVYVGEGWVVHAPEPGRYVQQVRYDRYPVYGYGRVD